MKIETPEEERELKKLARALAIIPDCPRGQDDVEALAVVLEQQCNDWEEAQWVVQEAQKWQKWQGPYGLIELLKERRRPAGDLRPELRTFDMGEKPPVTCQQCQDTGVTQVAGRKQLCDCSMGQWFRDNWPDFLQEPKPGLRKLNVPSRPITQADVDDAVEELHGRSEPEPEE